MEEYTIDISPNVRQEAKVGMARTSTGQGAIHEEGSSSVTLDEGSTSYQRLDARDASDHSDAEEISSSAKPSAGTSKGKMVEIYEEKPGPIHPQVTGSILLDLSKGKSPIPSEDLEGFKGICNKALMKTVAHQLVEALWEKVAIPDKQSSSYLVHSHITLLFEAAKVGNVEFLNIITRSYPDLLWQLDEDDMSLFHIAIKYRQESVVNLIYEIDTITYSLASFITLKNRDNILHLAGNLAPLDRVNIVLGGFRMQRELLWFKEIETIVPPSYVNMKNKDGLTPKELFKKKHKDLQIEAEMWMKSTSNNCMVVATLIAAVVFAAVFSVPGGNNQEHNQEQGTPILLRNTWFKVFFISDAIALFSSSASILLFLSMFVSRFREEDFYGSVPSKLLLALTTLFISIMGMMVAFSAACILMYSRGTSWAPVVLSALAVIPITSFSLVNCKELFVDLIVSSYKSRFLFRRPSKCSRLFSRKMPNREWINRKYEIQAKRNERENVGGSRNVEERSPRKECELTPFG